MTIKELYTSLGILSIDDLNIENVAHRFNITLLKDFPVDVRIHSNDLDIIMLQTKNKYEMTEVFFHELAHVLCHNVTHTSEMFRKYCEGQANKLMYDLAVPEFMLTSNEIDYLYIHINFNVSKKFALTRIEQLKMKNYMS